MSSFISSYCTLWKEIESQTLGGAQRAAAAATAQRSYRDPPTAGAQGTGGVWPKNVPHTCTNKIMHKLQHTHRDTRGLLVVYWTQIWSRDKFRHRPYLKLSALHILNINCRRHNADMKTGVRECVTWPNGFILTSCKRVHISNHVSRNVYDSHVIFTTK